MAHSSTEHPASTDSGSTMDMIRSLQERALPITTIRIEEAYD